MKYNIELLNQMANVSEDTLAYQYISYLKKGGGIHIKKKNRGSFTRWCGGNVTEECIRKGKTQIILKYVRRQPLQKTHVLDTKSNETIYETDAIIR